MKHNRRLAAIEQRLFAAQVHAMERLTADELRAFVDGFERIVSGSDITPEEAEVKRRWLDLVREYLGNARPYDALQDRLAVRLRPPPPADVSKNFYTAPATVEVEPTPEPDAEPTPWNYQMARWQYCDVEPGPTLRKIRANARARQR